MNYPVTIIDNFFADPDAVVKMASEFEYFEDKSGAWPGKRTRSLFDLNEEFARCFAEKLFTVFYRQVPNYIQLDLTFQIVNPFDESRNGGWIHADCPCHFGGIVYLTKDPDPDTGTSIYTPNNGYYAIKNEIKEMHYRGEDVHSTLYETAYNHMKENFTETVNVSNVYNRLMMFDGATFHGVRTFGNKPRLTMPFFVRSNSDIAPLLRAPHV